MSTFFTVMGAMFCMLIMLGVIVYISSVVYTFIENVRDYMYYKIRCESQEKEIQNLKTEIFKLQSRKETNT